MYADSPSPSSASASDFDTRPATSSTYFSWAYNNVPLSWVIASRPEPHLTHTFSRTSVALSFAKEEILINSDEARADVELYLRSELKKVRAKSPVLARSTRWPAEGGFLKLSAAADELFTYANVATRFIGDSAYGNPVSQFRLLLEVIDDRLPDRGETELWMPYIHGYYFDYPRTSWSIPKSYFFFFFFWKSRVHNG